MKDYTYKYWDGTKLNLTSKENLQKAQMFAKNGPKEPFPLKF